MAKIRVIKDKPKLSPEEAKEQARARMHYALATVRIVNELKTAFKGKESADDKDPIFKVYQKACERGFKEGNSIFQAGLPAYGFKGVTIEIKSRVAGHSSITSMGRLIEVVSLAALDVFSDMQNERRDD